MELYKTISVKELEQDVQQSFPIKHFSLVKVEFGGIIPIALVQFVDNIELANNWKDFNSYLSGEYIASIKDEFSKWNFYIFYFASDNVDKALKYEIENNKFSSRKIVIDNCHDLSEVEINNVISEHITNDNIKIMIDLKKAEPLKKDETIQKAIDQLPNKMTRLNKEDELTKALELIEKHLKDEI